MVSDFFIQKDFWTRELGDADHHRSWLLQRGEPTNPPLETGNFEMERAHHTMEIHITSAMQLGKRNSGCLRKVQHLGDIWETERGLGLVDFFPSFFGPKFWVSFLSPGHSWRFLIIGPSKVSIASFQHPVQTGRNLLAWWSKSTYTPSSRFLDWTNPPTAEEAFGTLTEVSYNQDLAPFGSIELKRLGGWWALQSHQVWDWWIFFFSHSWAEMIPLLRKLWWPVMIQM